MFCKITPNILLWNSVLQLQTVEHLGH
jgi:hypothetical protein